jgi:hypothetical protein
MGTAQPKSMRNEHLRVKYAKRLNNVIEPIMKLFISHLILYAKNHFILLSHCEF